MNEVVAAVFVLSLAALVLASPVLAVGALRRVRRLERRRADLEARVRALEGMAGLAPAAPVQPSPAPPPGPDPAAPPPDAAVTPPRAPRPVPRRAADWEALIGGRVLNRVGIAALLLAAAFFLKYAFDNQWIGPVGRVTLGLLSGTALVASSQWALSRGYRYFSEGLTGLGAGILYLSLWAGRQMYGFLPEGIALAAMIVVTAAVASLGLGRNSERLAFLAFLGGFLTPLLLSTGRDAAVELFTYLAVLNAAVLLFARLRSWRTMEPLALAWTVLYFAGWYGRFYEPPRLAMALGFALLFFVEFAVLNALRARREPRLLPEQVALSLANVAWILVFLHRMLYADHRWGLTVAVLALGAAHLAILRLVPRPAGSVPAARYLYGGLALAFVTLAIPIRLEGEWIAIAWAVEGAVLVWGGLRALSVPLRGAGMALLAVAPLVLLDRLPDAARPILNARLGSVAALLLCLGAALAVAARRRAELRPQELAALGLLAVGWNLQGVTGLSWEAWDFADRLHAGLDPGLARHLGLSLLWVAYGALLLALGLHRRSALLRWQGLVLLGAAAGKVFLHDLGFLRRAYRILAFLALGAALVVVSFLYQRRPAGGDLPPER